MVRGTQKGMQNWGQRKKLPGPGQWGFAVPILTWNLLVFLRILLFQVQIAVKLMKGTRGEGVEDGNHMVAALVQQQPIQTFPLVSFQSWNYTEPASDLCREFWTVLWLQSRPYPPSDPSQESEWFLLLFLDRISVAIQDIKLGIYLPLQEEQKLWGVLLVSSEPTSNLVGD